MHVHETILLFLAFQSKTKSLPPGIPDGVSKSLPMISWRGKKWKNLPSQLSSLDFRVKVICGFFGKL